MYNRRVLFIIHFVKKCFLWCAMKSVCILVCKNISKKNKKKGITLCNSDVHFLFFLFFFFVFYGNCILFVYQYRNRILSLYNIIKNEIIRLLLIYVYGTKRYHVFAMYNFLYIFKNLYNLLKDILIL